MTETESGEVALPERDGFWLLTPASPASRGRYFGVRSALFRPSDRGRTAWMLVRALSESGPQTLWHLV